MLLELIETRISEKPVNEKASWDFQEAFRIQFGAEGRTRTGTGMPTTPSRWRVYQFHHFGISLKAGI